MSLSQMRPLILVAAFASQAAMAAPEAPIIGQARAFMAAYAQDLKTGDRAAIAGRYSRKGAWSLGWTAKKFQPYPGIVADYAGAWQKPAGFSWEDLSYEPLGGDAVMVVGGFAWDAGDGKPALHAAYTAVLKREEGKLRIRLEHENPLRAPAR